MIITAYCSKLEIPLGARKDAKDMVNALVNTITDPSTPDSDYSLPAA